MQVKEKEIKDMQQRLSEVADEKLEILRLLDTAKRNYDQLKREGAKAAEGKQEDKSPRTGKAGKVPKGHRAALTPQPLKKSLENDLAVELEILKASLEQMPKMKNSPKNIDEADLKTH